MSINVNPFVSNRTWYHNTKIYNPYGANGLQHPLSHYVVIPFCRSFGSYQGHEEEGFNLTTMVSRAVGSLLFSK